jgi:hypothetical protein
MPTLSPISRLGDGIINALMVQSKWAEGLKVHENRGLARGKCTMQETVEFKSFEQTKKQKQKLKKGLPWNTLFKIAS